MEKIYFLLFAASIKLNPNVANKVSRGLPYKFFTTNLSIIIPTNPVNKKAVGIAINN